MSEGIEIGPHKIQFEDEFIAVRVYWFDPRSGQAEIVIEEKQVPSGYYYVHVHFVSGDSTRIDYDGGNPNRLQSWSISTTHRDDAIARVDAKKVR